MADIRFRDQVLVLRMAAPPTDMEVESQESRIPFHTAWHLCKSHRHCRSLNSHKDKLEGSAVRLENWLSSLGGHCATSYLFLL